jgi:TRAP-type mannitol/chloroaromatic compound transport system permease small subunit
VKAIERIDLINRYIYTGVSFLFVPMTLIAMFEVVMRYLFNSPTTWAWDINVQCFCAIVVLGGAHTLQQGGHVIMDIFVNRLQQKARLIVNLCVYIVFFFAIFIAIWQVSIFAWQSFILFEEASTIFSPPIYPIKSGILIGVSLLFLQGASLFVRDLMALKILSRERRNS